MSDWRSNLSKVKRMGVAKLSNMRKGESVDEAFAAKKARVIEVEKKVKELLVCMNTFASKALEMTGASTTVASRSARLTDAPPDEVAAAATDAADSAGINPVMAGAVEAGRLMQTSAEELSTSMVSITTSLNDKLTTLSTFKDKMNMREKSRLERDYYVGKLNGLRAKTEHRDPTALERNEQKLGEAQRAFQALDNLCSTFFAYYESVRDTIAQPEVARFNEAQHKFFSAAAEAMRICNQTVVACDLPPVPSFDLPDVPLELPTGFGDRRNSLGTGMPGEPQPGAAGHDARPLPQVPSATIPQAPPAVSGTGLPAAAAVEDPFAAVQPAVAVSDANPFGATSTGAAVPVAAPVAAPAPAPAPAPVPLPVPPPRAAGGEQAVVKFAFQGRQADEMSLNVGEMITILKKDDGGWWTGSKLNGNQRVQGLFPANYVEPC